MRRMRVVLSATVLVALLASIPAASGAVVVRGVLTSNGYRWRPKVTDVATGTKVTWKAVQGTHNVTAYKGDWSKRTTIQAGQSTSFIFNNAGVFKFRCSLHSTLSNGVCSGMCGKVVVG